MIIVNPIRLQILQYTFFKKPESNNIGALSQIGKSVSKKRYRRTSYSDGMENELVERAYADGSPKKITMAIANREESAIFGGLGVFTGSPNLLIWLLDK